MRDIMKQEEKLEIIKLIHKETGCGMMLITQCFDELICKLKQGPPMIMDIGHKLNMEWVTYDLRNNRQENKKEFNNL